MARRLALILCFAPLLILGCGGQQGKVPTYRVEGSVLVAGQPAPGALVVLHPVTPFDANADNPHAVVDTDGSFSISTYGIKDGAPAGEYKVAILPPDTSSEATRFALPSTKPDESKYDKTRSPDTSGLKVTINPSSNQLEPFKLN